MTATTMAERKRKSREKKRQRIGGQAYKEERRLEQQRYRAARVLTGYQKKVNCQKNRERQKAYRQKMKSKLEEDGLAKVLPKAFLNRSIIKAEKALPGSPRTKIRVVSKLAEKFTPTLVRKLRRRRLELQIREDTREAVQNFFLTSDLSWQAPGKKDYVILQDQKGEKFKAQVKYLTMTLKEAHALFQEVYADMKISFSKFCTFRPEQVKLRSETPASVCLCETHENMRLLLQPIPWLSDSTSDLIMDILCNGNPPEDCFMMKCELCQGKFQSLLNENFQHESMTKKLTYYQWSKREGRIKKSNSQEQGTKSLSL